MAADVVVLGGGLEGLVAAARLARGGRRPILFEASPTLGGLAAREEFHPGFTAPGVFNDLACTRRELLADLDLERAGLAWRTDEPPTLVAPGPDALYLHTDPERTTLTGDAATRFRAWRDLGPRVRDAVLGVLDQRPPDVASSSPGNLFEIARTALRVRRLGERDMFELMRVAPLSISDWTKEASDVDALRAGLAGPALIGSTVGPRAPGTSALLLLREVAHGPSPVGGAAALAEALVRRGRELGVELVTERAARQLVVEQGRVTGVELDDGERVACDAVLSTLGPRHTLLDLVAPNALSVELEREASTWRARGGVAVVRLALEKPPRFTVGDATETAERVTTAATLEDLEHAADAMKYGALPERPCLDIGVPSLAEPELAPDGGAVVNVLAFGVVRELRPTADNKGSNGSDDASRAELERRVLAELERVAPGTAAATVAVQTRLPADLEQQFGLAGGSLFGGDLTLDQLWVQRPFLAAARYSTPLGGLFLGGSSSHPGGPFFGGSGVLAAEAVLDR